MQIVLLDKSLVEKGLSKSVNDCCFVTTNFISTNDENTFSANECQRKVSFISLNGFEP